MLTSYDKGYVRDFTQYLDDAKLAMDTLLQGLPKPHLLFAHALGGHLGLRLLQDVPEHFDKAVLTAPMTGLATPIPRAALRLIAGFHVATNQDLDYMWGNGPFSDKELDFSQNRATSDKTRFTLACDYIRTKPELRVGGVTWGWLHAATRSIAQGLQPRRVRAISAPVLIASPGRDHFVATTSHTQLARLSEHIKVVPFADSRHDILQESDTIRAQFWNTVDAFTEH